MLRKEIPLKILRWLIWIKLHVWWIWCNSSNSNNKVNLIWLRRHPCWTITMITNWKAGFTNRECQNRWSLRSFIWICNWGHTWTATTTASTARGPRDGVGDLVVLACIQLIWLARGVMIRTPSLVHVNITNNRRFIPIKISLDKTKQNLRFNNDSQRYLEQYIELIRGKNERKPKLQQLRRKMTALVTRYSTTWRQRTIAKAAAHPKYMIYLTIRTRPNSMSHQPSCSCREKVRIRHQWLPLVQPAQMPRWQLKMPRYYRIQHRSWRPNWTNWMPK